MKLATQRCHKVMFSIISPPYEVEDTSAQLVYEDTSAQLVYEDTSVVLVYEDTSAQLVYEDTY